MSDNPHKFIKAKRLLSKMHKKTSKKRLGSYIEISVELCYNNCRK